MNGQQFAEALARCAGKCGLPMSAQVGGSGLACLDLMAALGKAEVPELARRLARWKYLDDPGERTVTLGLLFDRFRLPDALLGAALWEWLSPAICLTCCGGQAQYAHLDQCPACGGTGVPNQRHAPPAGLSTTEWVIWEEEYHRTLAALHDLTRLACIRAAAWLTEPDVISDS